MNYVSLILRVLAVIGAIVALALWYTIDGKLDDAQTQLKTAQTQNAELTEELETAQSQFSTAQSQVQNLESVV